MSIAIVCYPVFDVLSFDTLPHQALLLHNQKFSTNIAISEKQKELLRWNQSIFDHFKEFSVAKNCLRPESAPLIIPTA